MPFKGIAMPLSCSSENVCLFILLENMVYLYADNLYSVSV